MDPVLARRGAVSVTVTSKRREHFVSLDMQNEQNNNLSVLDLLHEKGVEKDTVYPCSLTENQS